MKSTNQAPILMKKDMKVMTTNMVDTIMTTNMVDMAMLKQEIRKLTKAKRNLRKL